MADRGGLRGCRAKRRQQQRANELVQHQVGGQSQLCRELARPLGVCKELLAKPVGGAEELAGEYVGLDLLPLPRGIALHLAHASVDDVAAQSGRPDGDFVRRVLVQLEMADLVGDDDDFILRLLMLGDVDQPRLPVEEAKNALVDDAARLVVPGLQVVELQCRLDQRPRTAVASVAARAASWHVCAFRRMSIQVSMREPQSLDSQYSTRSGGVLLVRMTSSYGRGIIVGAPSAFA